MTWRWGQHSMRANLPDPRSDEEMADWKARDPIARLRSLLSEREVVAVRRARRDRRRGEAGARRRRGVRARAARSPSEELLKTAVYAPHVRLRGAGRARQPRADLRPGAERGDGPGDGARSDRLPDGRGRRRDRRHLPGEQGPDGAVRRGAGARHADLRGDLLRRRRRRGDRRHAPDRRGPDLRLRHPDDGHDRQSGGEVPLHAGRPADRAAGDPRAAGRRHPPRRAAQPEPGGLVRARAGPRGGRAVLAPTTPRAC